LPGHFSFFIPRHAVGGEGERANAGPEPTLKTSLSQVIQQGHFFGDTNGVPQWQDVNERAQTNFLCSLRCRAEKGPGTRTLGKAQVKVMFRDENRSPCRLDRRIPTSPGGLHTCPRRNVPACHSFACDQRFQASSSVFLILLVRFLSGSLLTGSCRTFFLTQVS